MVANKGLIFKKIPTGWPVAGEHLAVEAREFDVDQEPPANGITVKIGYFSFDPYQRGRMRDSSQKSYSPAYPLGKPIDGGAIGVVLKSNNSRFKPGDLINGLLGAEQYAVVEEKALEQFKVIHNPHKLDLKHFLGALGMPGLTAYSSFYAIGKPKKGETIFVSAASGAVGQIVGQLAKHEGLKVIGSVGSDEKLDFITKELGFDAGFNYKKEKAPDALARLAPNGIDIYYENVGGEQLDAALGAMNDFGRIIACGMISQYNLPADQRYGVKNIFMVISKRLTIRGFIQGDKDMGPVYRSERDEKVADWLSDGTFKAVVDVTEGIDSGAEGFIGMLEGKNFGKAVLKISDL